MADIEVILKTSAWTFVTILSLPLNLLCLVVLRRTRGVEDVTKVFLVSLTVADLIFCFFRIIPAIGMAALNSWPYGEAFCLIQGAVIHPTMFAMFLSLLAVNVERYIAIAHPLKYPSIVSVKGARITVVCFWIVSILILALTWIESRWKPAPDEVAQICFLWKYYHSLNLDLHMFYIFYIPFIITMTIFVLFSLMMVIARKHYKRIRENELGRKRIGRRHRDTRAAKTFFLMAMSQAVSNLPWMIAIFVGDVPDVVIFIAEVLFASAGWWDVVVYYLRNRAFRSSANKLSSQMRSSISKPLSSIFTKK